MPRTTEPIREVEVTRDGRRTTRYEVKASIPRRGSEPRRQIKRRFDRRRDAVEWLAEVRAGVAEELRPKPVTGPTFAAVAESWLELKRRTVRTVTASNYAGAVRVWTRHLGEERLIADLTKPEIESLVNAYQDAGKSVARTGYLLMVLRQILDEACEEGLCARNVAARVRARGAAPKEREALSAAHVAQLRQTIAEHRLEALWLLSLAGLRRSEVLGLKWTDVDLDTRRVSITRGRVQVGGSATIEETPTKTRNGTRALTLPESVADALKRLRSSQAEEFGIVQVRDGYLGVDEIGEPIRPEWYSDEWRRLCQRAEVPVVTLHAARHTSVTLMRDLGIPDHLVAEWHGHDEVVMRRTYSHASESGLEDAGDRLFAATGGGA